MKPKTLALVLIAAIEFASPLVEKVATGGVSMTSGFGLAALAAEVVLLFWWYHVDKKEHGYRAGPLMNGGMLFMAAVALPIYFVRTRGWRRGGRAIALAAAFLALTLLLGEAGEWLGGPPMRGWSFSPARAAEPGAAPPRGARAPARPHRRSAGRRAARRRAGRPRSSSS